MKKLLDNNRTKELIELIYTLDSEGRGITIENHDGHRWVSVNVDSETIILNSENNLAVPIDDVTIFINSEGLLEASGLSLKEGEAIRIDSEMVDGLPVNTINVRYDSETIFLNDSNELEVRFDKYLDNQAVFNASTFIPRKGLLLTEKDTGYLKVGDGEGKYTDLKYVLTELTKEDIDEIIY